MHILVFLDVVTFCFDLITELNQFPVSFKQVEPLIQKDHESMVHHILLYQCSSTLNDSVLDYGHECYHPNMPDAFLTCETVIFAWAIGGEVR